MQKDAHKAVQVMVSALGSKLRALIAGHRDSLLPGGTSALGGEAADLKGKLRRMFGGKA
jgi:hypothetical protein